MRVMTETHLCGCAVCVCLWLQTEWELRGLDSGYAPASFDLGVRGSLFADRSRGPRAGCWMRSHLEIAITCVLPPPLCLVPEGVLRGVAESVRSASLAARVLAQAPSPRGCRISWVLF